MKECEAQIDALHLTTAVQCYVGSDHPYAVIQSISLIVRLSSMLIHGKGQAEIINARKCGIDPILNMDAFRATYTIIFTSLALSATIPPV